MTVPHTRLKETSKKNDKHLMSSVPAKVDTEHLKIICLEQYTTLNSTTSIREQTIPSDTHLLEKLLPTFVDTGCRVVSATDPTAVFLVF
jgi:hypothetical protein